MISSLVNRIKNDLKDCQIDWKVALGFIPIAFFTYLFHEFGHWIVGEILGNDMIISLNNSSARNGNYINDSHNLYISIGGPAFTLLLALIFLVLTKKTKSIYAYSVVFFAAFSRFFSIVFGGFCLQDEARISALLNINMYATAIIVLFLLILIVFRSSIIMKLDLKAVGYFVTLSTLTILLVIGINELIG